jgi:hypothetical protein
MRYSDAAIGFGVMLCSAAAILALFGYELVIGFALGVLVSIGYAVIVSIFLTRY